MFCYKCGSEIPDNARICPFCGETLVELEEDSKEITIPQTSVMDSDVIFSLGSVDDIITVSQNSRNEINLFIENSGDFPKYEIEVRLSGPPHIYIPDRLKKFRVLQARSTKQVTFTFFPRAVGTFTLNATLLYESVFSLELPVQLHVETTKNTNQDSYHTPSSSVPSSSERGTLIVVAIILGIIALILVGYGIPTAFNSPSVGITMIVIGIIIFTIATQGKCCYCFFGCDGCDCDGCDCDC